MKNELIRTQEWGIKVGLTGSAGRGQPHKQALKILEEVGEVIEAHAEWQALLEDSKESLKKEVLSRGITQQQRNSFINEGMIYTGSGKDPSTGEVCPICG